MSFKFNHIVPIYVSRFIRLHLATSLLLLSLSFREITVKIKAHVLTTLSHHHNNNKKNNNNNNHNNNKNYTGHSRYKHVRSILSKGKWISCQDKYPYWRVAAETLRLGCRS